MLSPTRDNFGNSLVPLFKLYRNGLKAGMFNSLLSYRSISRDSDIVSRGRYR